MDGSMSATEMHDNDYVNMEGIWIWIYIYLFIFML